MDQSFRVLSLDGGGIRGVIAAVWLDALERRLGESLHKVFDLVAGTSTGGLLACGIGAGLSVRDIVNLYQEKGRRIFPSAASRRWNRLGRTFTQGPSAPKYSPDGLERELRGMFGGMTLGQLSTKHTLVTAYNVLSREAIVFKSNKPEHENLLVWEVCRATSAAPTYFPAHAMRLEQSLVPLVDGGVVANNPSVCAIAEAIRLQREKGQGDAIANLVVASFGTGSTTRSISVRESREWGLLEWAAPIIDVLFEGSQGATDYVARQIVPPGRYFRFQTALDEAYDDMDNADATNVNALMATAEHYLRRDDVRESLERLTELLKR